MNLPTLSVRFFLAAAATLALLALLAATAYAQQQQDIPKTTAESIGAILS